MTTTTTGRRSIWSMRRWSSTSSGPASRAVMMDLLSRAEAAALLGCSVATVRRLQQRGRLTPRYPDGQRGGGHGVLAYYEREQVECVRREREPRPARGAT